MEGVYKETDVLTDTYEEALHVVRLQRGVGVLSDVIIEAFEERLIWLWETREMKGLGGIAPSAQR